LSGTGPDAASGSEGPPGIDVPRVTEFFARHVPGGAGRLRFSLLAGGRSNLTYRVEREGVPPRLFVLRRPPLGHVLPTAHDMAREHRVLSALARTDVPVARPLALCEDPSVNGAPFYVMEYRPGVVLERELPPGFADDEDARRGISLALVDTLVRLHAVDVDAVGLAGFGRPDGYLERQVRRWVGQWERSRTRPLPGVDALAGWLAETRPASPSPTLVHGDYRLGNLALDPEDPGRVRAIFDWEMATLGDPLSDLGYTLVFWGDASDRPELRAPGSYLAVTARPGFLSRAELVEEYARRSGRDSSAIDWYHVLGLFKLAIISEGIHARFLMGKTVGEGFEGMGAQVEQLVQRGVELMARAGTAGRG